MLALTYEANGFSIDFRVHLSCLQQCAHAHFRVNPKIFKDFRVTAVTMVTHSHTVQDARGYVCVQTKFKTLHEMAAHFSITQTLGAYSLRYSAQ